jgi:hypothetical protein
MIRDVTEFRRTGVASRRVTELNIPVAAWRAAMCHAGRRDDARVRTFLLPPTIDADDPRDQLVFAVRTDPPPDPAVQQQGLLRWCRVDELNMPFDRWRAALHRKARKARKAHVRVHTFRVAPTVPDQNDDPDQLVYAFWIDPTDPRQTPTPSPPPAPAAAARCRREPLPVTNLADYATNRSHRAASIARHRPVPATSSVHLRVIRLVGPAPRPSGATPDWRPTMAAWPNSPFRSHSTSSADGAPGSRWWPGDRGLARPQHSPVEPKRAITWLYAANLGRRVLIRVGE